jgi:hypothetical protein
MEIIQTFPKGTTIELGIDSHGNQVHRVCTAGGSLCRYVEPIHVAFVYAEQFEEWYAIKPESV